MSKQLNDDRNFIFNSQGQFNFNSAQGYEITPRQFNKHQRGYGNNLVLPQANGDRSVIKDMMQQREKVSKNPAVVDAYMMEIEDNQPLRMPAHLRTGGGYDDSICETNEEHLSQKEMTTNSVFHTTESFDQTHSTLSNAAKQGAKGAGKTSLGASFTARATLDAW